MTREQKIASTQEMIERIKSLSVTIDVQLVRLIEDLELLIEHEKEN